MTRSYSAAPLEAPDLDTALSAMRERSLRVSASRRLVLETLYVTDEPLTAEQIANGLDGRMPSSDLTSVYRNLETLEEIGLVRHFHVGHGPGLYARAGTARREFLLCDLCGSLRAVAPGDLDRGSRADPRTLRPRRALRPPPDRRALRALRMTLLAMHIPDGFLSAGVAAVCALAAIAAVAIDLRVAERDLDDARAPLLGVVAAFIFAAQMLNFPVAGGTSGHFLGAALAAVLLGPWLACLVMAVVLAAQALIFADGGITALGANILNMGVVGALMAGLVIGFAAPRLPEARGAFLGLVGVVAWLAVMAGAAATSVELAISGTVPLGTVPPAMLGVHTLIGFGEAVITVAATSAMLAARPDLVALAPPWLAEAPAPAGTGAGGRRVSRVSVRVLVIVGLAIAVGLATAVSPYASSSPDGLEKVAESKAFLDDGKLHSLQQDSPISRLRVPRRRRRRVATGLAGFAGTLIVFGLGYGIALPPEPSAPPASQARRGLTRWAARTGRSSWQAQAAAPAARCTDSTHAPSCSD